MEGFLTALLTHVSLVCHETEKNKGKSIVELGLDDFNETEIRSSVIGINIKVTQCTISKVIGVFDSGMFEVGTKFHTNKYTKFITHNLFQVPKDFDKGKQMHHNYKIIFKMIIRYLIPRQGSSDQISWDYKHVIRLWFKPGSELGCIHIQPSVWSYCEDQHKQEKNVLYARLLYEIFHQSKLVDALEKLDATSELSEEYGRVMSSELLVSVGILQKNQLLKLETDFIIRKEKRNYIENFPYFTKHGNLKVL